MSGTDPAGLRDELADALVKMWTEDAGESIDTLPELPETLAAYLDALLPTVQRLLDVAEKRGAARALNDAADSWWGDRAGTSEDGS